MGEDGLHGEGVLGGEGNRQRSTDARHAATRLLSAADVWASLGTIRLRSRTNPAQKFRLS